MKPTLRKERAPASANRDATIPIRPTHTIRPSRQQRLLAFKKRAVSALLEKAKAGRQRQLFGYRKSSRRAGGGDNKGWRNYFRVHPTAEVFPLLPPDQLRKLAKDIDENSLKVSIQTRSVAGEDRPFVVDGRNRLDAMESLGWQIVNGKGEWIGALAGKKVEHQTGRTHEQIRAEVIALNIRRRHLTKEEQVELIDKVLKAGRTDLANMARSVKRGAGGRLQGSTKDEHKAAVVEQSAKVGISPRTVRRVLSKAKPTKPREKLPVDKLKSEYVHKRFGRFLSHWPHAQWRTVRKLVHEFTAPT
jgi:hypothetical protein